MKIASIVTTCRREGVSYLENTLASLHAAGFDPDVILDHQLKGSYRNFKDALAFVSQGDADAVIVFQDDIQVARGLREWLEENLWPSDVSKIGVVSLYTASPYDRATDGWHQFDLTMQFDGDTPWARSFGALAYLFSIEMARRFVFDNPRPEMLNATDRNVAEWAARLGLEMWLHSPSLTQHRGEVSTFTKRYPSNVPILDGLKECRRAKRFCEDVAGLR